jgi:hypothetical protein
MAFEIGNLGFVQRESAWRQMIGTESECETAARALIAAGQAQESDAFIFRICLASPNNFWRKIAIVGARYPMASVRHWAAVARPSLMIL